MNGKDNFIEIETTTLDILEVCLKDNVVFEAVDIQNNLSILHLEEIVTDAHPDQRKTFPKHTSALLVRFSPLQKGAAEIRADGYYTFSFQIEGTIFSFKGTLLGVDPESLLFTYCIENRLYKHQTRRSNRLTIETPDSLSASIGNKIFRLINISLGGIGIFVDEQDLFQFGQELPVKLFSENRVLEATGRVRHIAPLSRDGFICGLSLTFHNEKNLQHVQKFIDQTVKHENIPIGLIKTS